MSATAATNGPAVVYATAATRKQRRSTAATATATTTATTIGYHESDTATCEGHTGATFTCEYYRLNWECEIVWWNALRFLCLKTFGRMVRWKSR